MYVYFLRLILKVEKKIYIMFDSFHINQSETFINYKIITTLHHLPVNPILPRVIHSVNRSMQDNSILHVPVISN